MDALWIEASSERLMDSKWRKMLMVSVGFHLAVFSTLLFVPEPMPIRSIKGAVYEVSLVEMPSRKGLRSERGIYTKKGQGLFASRKAYRARRIGWSKEKERPVIIAKRTLETEEKKTKKKVETEKKRPLDEEFPKLEKGARGAPAPQLKVGEADTGISIRMYQLEVENRIKHNWSYPVAILGAKSQKHLESVVIITVQDDGAILKTWFKSRSSDVIFNQSVLKAVERSNPLPHFPEGYNKTYDEIEIDFNLRDLEGY